MIAKKKQSLILQSIDSSHCTKVCHESNNNNVAVSVSGQVKPFTRTALSSIFNEIISNYDKCIMNTQMIISGIAVNQSKLSVAEGNDDPDTDTTLSTHDEIVQYSAKCISQYRSAFVPAKEAFLSNHSKS